MLPERSLGRRLQRAATPLLLALNVIIAACGQVDPPSSSDADVDSEADSPECAQDNECDDGIACTIDHCEGGRCTHAPCLDCCDEGRVCIEGFGCGHQPTPCTEDAECQDSTPCTLDRCRNGDHCEHLPQNGLCDEGEVCLAALGCIPSPPEDCDDDDDCDVGPPCLGEWYCDPEFACQFLAAVDCDDGDDCTDDLCDDREGGCVHLPRDGDGDGYGSRACGGDDCDDGDGLVHPGALEVCDGVDDDCDGDIDEGCCVEGAACLTACGSEGSSLCNPDGTEGACQPPVEACNGADDDCDGVIDESFACSPPGVAGECPTACGTVGTRECLPGCSWGECLPPPEVCNGVDDDCDGDVDEACCDEGAACLTSCGTTGSQLCNPDGTEGACQPPAEACNSLDDDCDGEIDDGFACSPPGLEEECETSCGSTGLRECLPGCAWNRCVPPEEACNGRDDDCDDLCDDGFTCCRGESRPCVELSDAYDGGLATCDDRCSGWITSGCTGFDPSGTYTLSPPPSHTCAMGLVSFTISAMTFIDSGVLLSVSGAPCTMTGPSAQATMEINVTCTIFAVGGMGCDETYSLVGSFDDADSWTGTFSAGFSGTCLGCTAQSWPAITGSR